MSTDGLVGFPSNHDVLAIGDRIAPLMRREGAPRVGIARENAHEDLGLHQAFPETEHQLSAREGEGIGTVGLQRCERSSEQIGRVYRVGVGEEQNVATRLRGALMACPILAQPSLGKLGTVDYLDALGASRSHAPGPSGRIVIAAVIDHDDFEGHPLRLCQRGDNPLDVACLVAGWHDHAHARCSRAGNQLVVSVERYVQRWQRARKPYAREKHYDGQGPRRRPHGSDKPGGRRLHRLDN